MRLSPIAIQITEVNHKHDKTREKLLPALLATATAEDLTSPDKEGNTILHMLAHDGGLRWVPDAIKTETNLSITNPQGDTPIHNALGAGNISELPPAVVTESNLRVKNRVGQTPLQRAAAHNRLKTVPLACLSREALLERDGNSRNVFDLVASMGGIQEIPAKFITLEALIDRPNKTICPMENLLYFGTIKDLPIFKPYGAAAYSKEDKLAWIKAIQASNIQVDKDCAKDPDISRVPFDENLLHIISPEYQIAPIGDWATL